MEFLPIYISIIKNLWVKMIIENGVMQQYGKERKEKYINNEFLISNNPHFN